MRKGMEDGKAPGRREPMDTTAAGTSSISNIPLSPFLPILGRVAGTGPQPLSGDTITVKQAGRDLRAVAAIHHGLEQHRRID